MEQERDVYQIARTKEELTPRVPVMVAKHAKRSNKNIEKKIWTVAHRSSTEQ